MPRGVDRYDEALRQARLFDILTLKPRAYVNFNRLGSLDFATGISTARNLAGVSGLDPANSTGSAQPTRTLLGKRATAVFTTAGSQTLRSPGLWVSATNTYTIIGLARLSPSNAALGRIFSVDSAVGSANLLFGWWQSQNAMWFD